ncbi:hypothetical protein SCP_0201290 [Sparassis crispa]|uniref:Uncharacterized protein n=1 Tax=Sparassis crispa TaxID=139825 RepID=A0A401G9T4_9APHY|nr:hypothetical protein SCP_0201290 [Sparassis crispa]GBE78932.1 hypothetical protein SCP_0201290 [Sparassis crispa]
MISVTEEALIFLTNVGRFFVSLLPTQATQAFKTGRVNTSIATGAETEEHI